MKGTLVNLTCEIELHPGEKLTLPEPLIDSIGPGRWVITLQPVTSASAVPVRRHLGFLNSYSPEDEGLYDDYPPR